MGAVEFVYDDWVYVESATAEGALRFLGAPKDWRVEWYRPSARKGAQVWRVWSKGLKL